MDAEEKVWKDAAVLCILRLYWRVVYRHMVRYLLNGTPFHSRNVQRDLCREFMEAILSYQSERRNFYHSRVDTARTEVLPLKAAKAVASLGNLDVNTGDLEVRQPIVDILV